MGATCSHTCQCIQRAHCCCVLAQDLHLPSVFKSMESSKEELDVVEYSLTQTTLENVFVALAQPEASAQSQQQQSEQ